MFWDRRLEKGKFIFPKDAAGHIQMTETHFKWFLTSDIQELKKMVLCLQQENKKYFPIIESQSQTIEKLKAKNDYLREQFKLTQLRKYGASSEKNIL